MHCDLLRLRNFNPNRMLVSRGVASILIRCLVCGLPDVCLSGSSAKCFQNVGRVLSAFCLKLRD